jgi:hypothetical protein
MVFIIQIVEPWIRLKLTQLNNTYKSLTTQYKIIINKGLKGHVLLSFYQKEAICWS